ncbi:glycerate kinase [Microbacterium sp. TL13]|uniref:glycerate kinase n=1 Tax=Microbacterium sp. TL13 TaxID=2576306 RepID=UPI003FA53F84
MPEATAMLTANTPHADFVVTGKGPFNRRTAAGKAPLVVENLAHALHVRTGLVVGRVLASSLLDDC